MHCEVWKKGRPPVDCPMTERPHCKKDEQSKTAKQINATMREATAVLLLALVAITLNRVGAYPIIAEIDEDDETVSHQERARMSKSKHHTSVSVGTGNVWDRRHRIFGWRHFICAVLSSFSLT